MSLSGGAHKTRLPNPSLAGEYSSSIGVVPEQLLRDVMSSALPVRPDTTMNGECWRVREGGEGGVCEVSREREGGCVLCRLPWLLILALASWLCCV